MLPLNPRDFTRPGSILVAGPTSTDGDNLQGNYAMHTDIGSVSITDGVINALGSSAVSSELGCPTVECTSTIGFPAAIAAAKKAKAVVLVLGTKHDCDDPVACEGEFHDRTTIALAGKQLALAAALAATGKPLICVLVHGGSLALDTLLSDCDAIVDSWFPGAQGGNGVAGMRV